MKAKALKTFLHDELGRIEKGQEFEATAAQLSGVKEFVEIYQTKVVHQSPQSAGEAGNTKSKNKKAGK